MSLSMKMPEIYQLIAERDTFEIFVRNLKECLLPENLQNKKKKKKPEELNEIVLISL